MSKCITTSLEDRLLEPIRATLSSQERNDRKKQVWDKLSQVSQSLPASSSSQA